MSDLLMSDAEMNEFAALIMNAPPSPVKDNSDDLSDFAVFDDDVPLAPPPSPFSLEQMERAFDGECPS